MVSLTNFESNVWAYVVTYTIRWFKWKSRIINYPMVESCPRVRFGHWLWTGLSLEVVCIGAITVD